MKQRETANSVIDVFIIGEYINFCNFQPRLAVQKDKF